MAKNIGVRIQDVWIVFKTFRDEFICRVIQFWVSRYSPSGNEGIQRSKSRAGSSAAELLAYQVFGIIIAPYWQK